jgi:hypothetical protein
MSAKTKPKPQPPGADPGRPSASPADGGKSKDNPILDAAFLLMGSDMKKFAESPHWWDDMLLLSTTEEARALKLLEFAGMILRDGMSSLRTWAAAKHAPAIKRRAEEILAELLVGLEASHLVRLIGPDHKIGPAFASRRMELKKATAKRSRYYAVNMFPKHLMKVACERFEEAWNSYPRVPAGRKPEGFTARICAVVHFIRPCWQATDPSKGEEDGIQLSDLFRANCRSADRAEFYFDDVLVHLAKELWPPYAAEMKDRACLKMRKLSERRRWDDGPDLGFAKWLPAIREAHLSAMAGWRLAYGDGAHPLEKP